MVVAVDLAALYARNVLALDGTRSTPSPDWLSAKETGDLLGVSARTVGRWIRDGLLRARRTAGGQFRVNREDVERLAADQEVAARQAPAHTTPRRKEDRTPPTS